MQLSAAPCWPPRMVHDQLRADRLGWPWLLPCIPRRCFPRRVGHGGALSPTTAQASRRRDAESCDVAVGPGRALSRPAPGPASGARCRCDGYFDRDPAVVSPTAAEGTTTASCCYGVAAASSPGPRAARRLTPAGAGSSAAPPRRGSDASSLGSSFDKLRPRNLAFWRSTVGILRVWAPSSSASGSYRAYHGCCSPPRLARGALRRLPPSIAPEGRLVLRPGGTFTLYVSTSLLDHTGSYRPTVLAIFACDFGRLSPRTGLPPVDGCPGAHLQRPDRRAAATPTSRSAPSSASGCSLSLRPRPPAPTPTLGYSTVG